MSDCLSMSARVGGFVFVDVSDAGGVTSRHSSSHLNDIVLPIFAVDSFDGTNIEASKHLGAGVRPESVPAESTQTRCWELSGCSRIKIMLVGCQLS